MAPALGTAQVRAIDQDERNGLSQPIDDR